MKRILYIAFWTMVPITILVLLGFSNAAQNDLLCNEVHISIDHESGMLFISKDDVLTRLRQAGADPTGKKLKDVHVNEMEQILLSNAETDAVNVYKTINGQVGINIIQRRPIVRVMNRNGRHFYIDQKGFQMPVSTKFFPRVPVVHGYVNEPLVTQSAMDFSKDSLLRTSLLTDEIFAMANFIRRDNFWSAQIQEIYFNKAGDMELVPMVGDHRIVFGDTTRMEEKFNKLLLFYKKGINTRGWNEFDTINLKYKHQIVCSKRN